METVSGWDDGEVRLVFEELEAEGGSTVASAHDNDVLIRRKDGHGTPVTSHCVYDGRLNSEIIHRKKTRNE